MSQVIAHAPAKINLALEVASKRHDEEKHRVTSVFCTTALSDTLIFDFASSSEPFTTSISIESTDFDVSFIKQEANTLTQVVDEFKKEYGSDYLPTGTLSVQLIKSIPTQAGLGGGSSDAAAMLRMLCWLAQVEPLSDKSLSVARAVGADVSFFLYAPKDGLCALMDGYGDTFTKAVPKPQMHLALVKPQGGVSSRKAYVAFDAQQQTTTQEGCTEKLVCALESQKGLKDIAALCGNALEPVATQLVPEIANIKAEMLKQPGVLTAVLTGSGSVLFALCESADAAHVCMQHFANKGLWAIATST